MHNKDKVLGLCTAVQHIILVVSLLSSLLIYKLALVLVALLLLYFLFWCCWILTFCGIPSHLVCVRYAWPQS